MADDPVFDPAQPFDEVPATPLAEPAAAPPAEASAFDPSKPFEDITPSMSWSDVGKGAIKNFGPSAAQFGSDVIQPIIHPIDTAVSLKNLGQGILEKTGILSGDEHKKYADAVGRFFADRYGGIENVKRTMATDPVGIASDLSVFFTAGGGAAARLPLLGRAGQAAATGASRLGSAIDPINVAAKAVDSAGRLATGVIGGLGTHTGGESLRIAARAGYEGGDAAKAFRENLRDTAPMESTVDAARQAVHSIRDARGAEYRMGMAALGADQTILDFGKIDQAYANVVGVKNYKGQDLSPATADVRQKLENAIEGWRVLDPKEFHTVEGLDALKQKIGDIREGTERGTPARRIADEVYRGVRGTIVDQAPQYNRVMRGYEYATKQLSEIERTLSLNPNATIDTSLRKLQSILRDNVNTSYGRRKELAQYLVDAGAPHLMERLAGQALKPGVPRGLGKLGAQLALELGIAGAGTAAAGLGPGAIAAAAALPLMSPRLMGEAHYYAGRAASPLKSVPIATPARSAFQIGRLSRVENDKKNMLRAGISDARADDIARALSLVRGSGE